MTTILTVRLIPMVAERLNSVAQGLNRSKDVIVNDALIRELGLEGTPLSDNTVWGPKKKERP